MKQVIEDRELLLINGLPGTCHRPAPGAELADEERVGILFLNGLYATRAANGDAAVRWAATLAERGYPSFRFDLSGFGDSMDDPPADWLNYINAGKYGSVVAELAQTISRKYRLPGVVLAGHCAGAVSAIYAAALGGQCRGLVLIDPYFNLPQADLSGVRRELNLWARRSRLGGALSGILDRLKQGRRLLRLRKLPPNANLRLLRCWKQVAASGLPVLILRAPSRGSTGVKPRVGEFDYLEYILKIAGSNSQVCVKIVDGASHSFSDRQGRIAVPELMNRWLKASFSAAAARDRSELTAISPVNNDKPGAGVTYPA